MARKILMNVAEGDECRIAVLENNQLFEFFVDRPSQLKHVGNIYKSVVNNVEPGIQAAFIDIGLERNGFLHVSDVNYSYQNSPELTSLFSKTLRIKEDVADDAIFETETEQDVEEVDQFVGDGTQPVTESKTGAEDPEFLEKLDEEHAGHPVTDSPLEVELPEKEPPTPEQQEKAKEEKAQPEGESAKPEKKKRRPRRRRKKAEPRPEATHTEKRTPEPESAKAKQEKAPEPSQDKPDAKTEEAKPAESASDAKSEKEPVKLLPGQGPRRAETEAADKARQEAAKAQQTAKEEKAEAAAEEPKDKPKRKRRRTPKKRGGRLPKRVLEQDQPEAKADGDKPKNSSDVQANVDSGKSAPDNSKDTGGTKDIDGNSKGEGGDGGPIPGPMYRYHRGPQPKIQNILKRGQEVVVQVTKASQGGKGPGLTTFVSLPGRYMVLTPNTSRGGVSRKIEDGKARNTLRKMLDKLPVPEGMGVIIRTAAINRSFDDLLRDLNYLLRVWSVMVERIHEAKAPALLYSDSDPAIRTVRDYFTADTEEIVIDDREVYERVVAFFDQLMPSFRNRVKLYESDIPLFFDAGLETQIDHIFDKKVPLKSGGYLFVEQTEALISIDVNSGKFTSAGDAEKTAYLTNKEAIPEICRQLRLRDLAGIVCCDLIDMSTSKHRSDIEQQLRRELRKDRARTKVARMSPFGVIEMTRQRVRPSIKNYTFVNCPTCAGFGMVRSAETMCLQLIRRMKLALVEDRVTEVAVQVHPHVLSHLHSEFRDDIDDLEEQFDKRIVFEYAKDLVLGQTRIFYLNDRGNRVLYDMDQRINTFVGKGPKSKENVQVPQGASGAASPAVLAKEKSEKKSKRRRRGGRRQREKELDRQKREERIKQESEKAVTFGDTLPAAKVEVVSEEKKAASKDEKKEGEKKSRRRGRRGGRKVREREARKSAKEGKEKSGKKKESAKKSERKSSDKKAAESTKKTKASSASRGKRAESTSKKASEKKTTTKKSSAKKATTTSKSTAKKTTAKKTPARKPATKKPAAKKAPAKKTTTKKTAAKKPATKKTPAKKAPAKKTATKKTTTKKAATKKAATKKPAAKKTAAKKPAAKKTPAKKAAAKKTTTKKAATKKAATKKPAAKKTASKKTTKKK